MKELYLIPSLLLPAICASASAQTPQQPNVILIMTDQQRADLCGREGYPLDVTPFVDKLARENVWFDKAYTVAPASAPARISMMTGRFPSATHVRTNHNIKDAYYQKDMPAVFREEGYATALIGKNHSHLAPDDFDYWSSYGHWGKDKLDLPGSKEFSKFLNTESWGQYLPATPFPYTDQMPYQIVTQTLDWVGGQNGKPFFAWVSIAEPHNPYQVSEPYYSMFPPESIPDNLTSARDIPGKGEKYETLAHLEQISHVNDPKNIKRLQSNYLGMIRLIDDQIARLLEGLKEKGVYDNTIIIVLADHGDYFGEYGLMKKGAGTSEVLTRIPMVWAGPGIVNQQGAMDAFVSLADVFPTLCSAIGAEIPAGVQGRDLWPMLSGEEYPTREFRSIIVEQGFGGADVTREDTLSFIREGCLNPKRIASMDELNTWSQSGTQRMVRMGDWKLTVDNYGRGWMYNLKNDPYEVRNLFGSRRYSRRQAEMLLELTTWALRTQDPLPLPRNRYHFKRNPHNYLYMTDK